MNAVPTDFTGMTTRVVCPFCSSERRKSRLKEMTLTRKPDGAVVYYCHHCEANGSVQPEKRMSAVPRSVPAPTIVEQALGEAHYQYLSLRGISRETADRMKLFSSRKWFRRLNLEAECIGFPYFRNGALVSAKYRAFPDKDFTQDAGGAHDFWGIDHIVADLPIIIVEGEIDALSAMEAGLKNVLSVPGGAPMKVAEGKASAEEDRKFGFVWNARDILDAAPYVVLATDQDGPGQALMEELARRIGKEKCRIASFDAKDLNEILVDPARIDGKKDILDIIDQATPYPIAGLSDASTYQQRLEDLYTRGEGKGITTGFANVDSIYTVAPGQLTVVTGYPSSGKSNFVDQLMVNLARSHAWKFAIASFENQPEVHIMRLMEIYSGRRFHSGTNRMTTKERDDAFAFVSEHFLFIESGGEEPNTLDSILGRARAAVKRMGIRGLVIDPYNYIDLNRTGTETEAISDMLTRVKKFCSANDVHTWFVAHPSKIQRSGTDQPRPDGMSISGSMAWWAKTDVGLTVHRKDASVEIAVWKCRYRWVGRQGETSLEYEPSSGTYHEVKDAF
jgi:twinkle protein